jgi:hypothetical protein
MSGSEPIEKNGRATIWFLAIVAVIVFGTMLQDKPITIAASDNPPSISTPVRGFDAKQTSMYEQPLSQPGSQLFFGGWNEPQ